MDDPTRTRILDAAGPLFAGKGFDATTVREITDRAGTNLAAVNYHFRGKEDLYVETVRHAAHACEARAPTPSWPPGVPAERRLRDFVAAFVRRVLGHDGPAWHRLLIFRELADPRPGACEEFVKHFVRPTFETLLGVVRDLVPPATPPRALRLLAGSVIGQILHHHHCR
ncbi:MAG: TetR/AcrR family transcriptional regulator, partial [Gemmataceae bacterium]